MVKYFVQIIFSSKDFLEATPIACKGYNPPFERYPHITKQSSSLRVSIKGALHFILTFENNEFVLKQYAFCYLAVQTTFPHSMGNPVPSSLLKLLFF